MVSNQGKMRGRSKGLLRMKNLNRGQELVRITKFVFYRFYNGSEKNLFSCIFPQAAIATQCGNYEILLT